MRVGGEWPGPESSSPSSERHRTPPFSSVCLPLIQRPPCLVSSDGAELNLMQRKFTGLGCPSETNLQLIMKTTVQMNYMVNEEGNKDQIFNNK